MIRNTMPEPGYRPVLVREETKLALQRFRFSLNDLGRAQERRIADAMIFVALKHRELYDEVIERVRRLAIEDDRMKPLARIPLGGEQDPLSTARRGVRGHDSRDRPNAASTRSRRLR